MAKTIGYLVTWTTYGTWLQGSEKGYVKDGKVYKRNEQLRRDNQERLVKDAVRLWAREKKIVEEAIQKEAERYGIVLKALAVCSNHVHVVVGYSGFSIGKIVRQLKQAGRIALKNRGAVGKVWTRGYDKRYCFDKEALESRIDYVNSHNG